MCMNIYLKIERRFKVKKYFGSIKKSIDRGMITVGVKSANMLEINKIKGYITTLSDQKEQMIMEMGKKVYEDRKSVV